MQVLHGQLETWRAFCTRGATSARCARCSSALKEAYCGSIGYEYMHIPDRERCNWLRERIETPEKACLTMDSLVGWLMCPRPCCALILGPKIQEAEEPAVSCIGCELHAHAQLRALQLSFESASGAGQGEFEVKGSAVQVVVCVFCHAALEQS